jgi:site-specific DNA recombinase
MNLRDRQVAQLAAIYIRTSSEHQAEKASPEEQEADCRRLAEEHGLTVVDVYRDIERYRAGKRLVDPSGTRVDRPALVAMLKDAAAGKFGTILAWREDRLYRGMRAMLLVLETIQENNLQVLLARETFDPKLAPLKAWVAQMELEGMRERMTMGVKARLRAGKANTGQDRYGYKRVGEVIEIVEEEARWVRQVCEWYLQGTAKMEIRRRLIAANAPQKGSSRPRKVQWHISSINAIIGAAEEYASGVKIQTRCGEAFEIPVPPILDMETARKVKEMRQANKTHPGHNLKWDYLLGGMIYCPCGHKWNARTNSHRPMRKDRKGNLRPWPDRAPRGVYFCRQRHKELIHPECARTIGATKADKIVWDKVCAVIENPDLLLVEARRYIDELREQAESRLADRDRIQNQLETLATERQWVITQARKGTITEADMEYQLGMLTGQEVSLRQELAEWSEIVNLAALGDWEAQARTYIGGLRSSIEWLNAVPQTEEERREQFEAQRQIVKMLVQKVLIAKDKSLRVIFYLDVVTLLQQPDVTEQVQTVGTCTRRRSARPRPLREACA